MKEKATALLDKLLGVYISKKLSVFLISCVFVVLGKIDGIEWVNVAMVYIGSQGAVDIVKQLRESAKDKIDAMRQPNVEDL